MLSTFPLFHSESPYKRVGPTFASASDFSATPVCGPEANSQHVFCRTLPCCVHDSGSDASSFAGVLASSVPNGSAYRLGFDFDAALMIG